MDPREEAGRALEEIRKLLRASGISQRSIERRTGFSKGYLSQLLARNIDLKYWHIHAILEALGEPPSRFFAQLYPEKRRSALDHFRETSQPASRELEEELGRLYGSGVDSLRLLRRRLESCEQAIQELGESSDRRRGDAKG